jgi:hypothetical protein
MVGSTLVDDWVGQREGPVGGYRLGSELHEYWGWEMQISLGAVALFDSPWAKQSHGDGSAADRDCRYFLWDVSMLYYPWADALWRPYLRFGMGAARVEFYDLLGEKHAGTVLGMPVAAGIKFRLDEVVVLRWEVADHMAFGSGHGFNSLNNLSVTGGLDVRFGGPRKSYWPWNPGRHY